MQPTPTKKPGTDPAPPAPGAPAATGRTPRTATPRLARGSMAPPLSEPARPTGAEGAGDVIRTFDGTWREPFARKWGRRAVTIPMLWILSGLVLALLPFALVHGLTVDLARRNRWLWTRFYLLFAGVFVSHLVGFVALVVYYLAGGLWLGRRPASWVQWNRSLEAWWADKTIGLAEILYGVRFEVTGLDEVSHGPMLMLSRHTSVIDTILQLKIVGRVHPIVFRIVKKHELLWDPCVDMVSYRIPRTFVRRGSGNLGQELRNLTYVLDGADGDDAVLIFPEGTRFTEKKKAEILGKLRQRRPEMVARAQRLRNVLPARPAGTFALLDRRPDMDVVFCAHTGLEGASRLEDFVGGALLGKTVKIHYWRVPSAEIPGDESERTEWLCDWWQRVDDWIEANRS